MRRSYLMYHWVLTLLIAPFTAEAFGHVFGANAHQMVGKLVAYPLALIFSMVYSLPTLVIYFTCFFFLSKYRVDLLLSKLILIIVSVAGIFITMEIMAGRQSDGFNIAYSVTSLITGWLLNLKKPNVKADAIS